MDGAKVFWHLKQIELFAALDDEDLLPVAQSIKHQEVRKGESVAPRKPGTIVLLKSGRLKLIRTAGDGRSLTLDILEPGDIFGELTVAGGVRGDTAVEAMGDSLLCDITRETFGLLLKAKPEFAMRMVEFMDEKRRRFEVRLDELVYRDVATRLARLLLRLADEYGTVKADGIHLRLGFTHEELASLIATSRETLSKFMSEFRSRGLIDYGGKEIRLLDLPGLQEQAKYEEVVG